MVLRRWKHLDPVVYSPDNFDSIMLRLGIGLRDGIPQRSGTYYDPHKRVVIYYAFTPNGADGESEVQITLDGNEKARDSLERKIREEARKYQHSGQ